MVEGRTWLDKERKRQGWSGHEFARRIGYSPSQTHRFLTGEQPPSMRACRKIAAAFRAVGKDVTEQDVMRNVGRLSPLPDDYDKAQERELVEVLQELRYSDRKTLIEFAQFLLGREGGDIEGDEGD